MEIPELFRTQMRGRARRAFNGETVHRITEVSVTSLIYRMPSSLFDVARRQGPKVMIRKDKVGRIYIPRSVDL